MTKWEYSKFTSGEIIQSDSTRSEIEWLDELGAAGWELITVLSDGEESKEFYFKRPRSPKKGSLHML